MSGWLKKSDEIKSLKKSDEKIPSLYVQNSGKKSIALLFLTSITATINIDTIKKIFDIDIDIDVFIYTIQSSI